MEVHFDHGLNVLKSPFNNPILLYTYCSGQITKASCIFLQTYFIDIEIAYRITATVYCHMTYRKLSYVHFYRTVLSSALLLFNTLCLSFVNAGSDFQFPFPRDYSFFIFETDMDTNDV